MKTNIVERLKQNVLVAEKDKENILKFLDRANAISFGKISSRQEGYIDGDYRLPRCTSILQMDGTKAGALMEWSKRQVAGRIEELLLRRIAEGSLSADQIREICAEGLADPDKQKNEAAEIGTGAHDEVECWLCGEKELDECSEVVHRFAEAWERSGLTLIGTEIPVAWHNADGCGFGGRLDILAYKDGRFYIGDNKTSRSVHDSYGMQVAAYKAAVEQMSNETIKIAGGYIFHIPTIETLNDRQKKEYEKRGSLIELKGLEDGFEHYRLLLELYYKRNNKYF